jgi:hypothetical protein
VRKAADLANYNRRERRGGGQVRGDSALEPPEGEHAAGGFAQIEADGPTPDFVDDCLSKIALRRVDDVCARFEDAWKKEKKEQRPSLPEFLAGAQGPERAELLRELLRLDVHYRHVRGERVAADDHEGCFPDDVGLIRTVLAEGRTVATAPSAAGPDCDNPRQCPQTATPCDPTATGPPVATVGAEEGKPGLPVVRGYEILGLLGRGGMGVVYKARQTALKRLVALKMIPSADFASPQELSRFRAEAEAIARLRHPNIGQVYEVGEERGCPFFSLEFMEGGSLAARIDGTPQPPREAGGLVAVLARATHAAHQAGIVHRDLKPANVLLAACGVATDATPQAALPVPKITDFGLAKRLDGGSDQTHSGVILGTPSYMAPEQAEGRVKEVGPAADIYALAAILYELLTGRPPFKAATSRDMIEQVCTREPVPPSQLQPTVPRDLETVCLKGLRKDAARRYATAQDLADDLQRWLEGRPILARPVPAWERAWKWTRRRPATAGLLVALALLLGSVTGGLAFLLHQQRVRLEHSRAVNDLWTSGQEFEAQRRSADAKEKWDEALTILRADPGAGDADMVRRLEESSRRVTQRRDEQAAEQGLQAARQQFAERHARFRGHRDAALFHAVSIGAPDAVEDAVVLREAAAALAEFGIDANDPQALANGLDPFRSLAEPTLLSQVAEECVEVLLAWAEAEARANPAAGEGSRALGLLDGAAALARAHGVAASRALHGGPRPRGGALPPAGPGLTGRGDGADPREGAGGLARRRAGRPGAATASAQPRLAGTGARLRPVGGRGADNFVLHSGGTQ